ncbi:hypothetical protein [Streptomyces sp. YIM S03343]
MTLPAAFPSTVQRLARTVAGRRLLQVSLLVGGLFVLGFLYGGRAQAAEGVPLPSATRVASAAATDTSSGRSSIPATPDTSSVLPVPLDGVRELAKPLTEQVVPSVEATVSQVVQPVADTVKTVTDGLSEGKVTLPSLPSLPELPILSELPSLPGLPGAGDEPSVPASPTVPGDSALPVQPGQASPAPVAGTEESRRPAQTAAAHGDDDRQTAGRRAPVAAAQTVAPQTYGPSYTPADATPANGVARAAVGPSPRAGHAPLRQAPTGDPDGTVGNRSAAGDGASRHCDAHAAVTSVRRAPVLLVAGATACAATPGTRDRHRDIPVFPG